MAQGAGSPTGTIATDPPVRVVLAREPAVNLGPLTIAPALRQIVHADGREEIVEPKVMEVLVVLLRAGGRILARDELCAAAWDGRIVGDDAINRVLARLRRLSEGIGAGVFAVETITKVGYRLMRLTGTGAASASESATTASFAAVLAEPVAARAGWPDPLPAALGADPLPVADAAAAFGAVAAGTGAVMTGPRRGIDRRALIGGGMALAAAAGVGGWWWQRGLAATEGSVAVLPFANLSGDPGQAYFSDGIAEELRSALSRLVGLKVAARTSSELMRNADAATAAAKLGVANIVTGSVRRGSGTIRVSAQLIDGTTGLVRWSDSYDRIAGDVLTIESSIAESVAGELKIVLGSAGKLLLTTGGTANPAAYDAYLRGSAFWTEQKFDAALPQYAAAVAADPGFALAHTGLAMMRVSAAFASNVAVAPALARAEVEARRAVALAPRLGMPLAALGFILMCRLDLRGATAAQAAAYQLSPGDAYVVRNYARLQAEIGRSDAAVKAATRYAALDPLAANSAGALGAILFRAGRLQDAIATLRQALVRLPGDPEAGFDLSVALLAANQTVEAMKLAQSMPPDSWQALSVQAIALARLGDRPGSDRALDRLKRLDNSWYQVGEVLAQRGEVDAAFAALNRAEALVDPGLVELKVDPMMRPLHGDPRFAAMIRRIGFP